MFKKRERDGLTLHVLGNCLAHHSSSSLLHTQVLIIIQQQRLYILTQRLSKQVGLSSNSKQKQQSAKNGRGIKENKKKVKKREMQTPTPFFQDIFLVMVTFLTHRVLFCVTDLLGRNILFKCMYIWITTTIIGCRRRDSFLKACKVTR